MLFIVTVLVKCSVSFKFSTSIQSIRRSCHPNNAMIFDQNLFSWFIPSDLQMSSPSKWTQLCAETCFPPLTARWFNASNEYISELGSWLNKFYVPYQNSHINIICDSRVLSKLQGTYILYAVHLTRMELFKEYKSWKMSTCHWNDMWTFFSIFPWQEQNVFLGIVFKCIKLVSKPEFIANAIA